MRSLRVCLLFTLALASSGLVCPAQAEDLRRTAIVRAIESCRDSVVNIHGEKLVAADAEDDGRRVNGMGTGVVIDARGYAVTNFHVVDGVRNIEVTLASGRARNAKVGLLVPDHELGERVFEALVHRCLPMIHDHFQEVDVQLSVASLPWFLSL